jgi:arsenate reductase
LQARSRSRPAPSAHWRNGDATIPVSYQPTGELAMDRPYGMLFISRRNSARSIMAEAVVIRHGMGRFTGFSAGVEPAENVDPMTLQVLQHAGYPTEDLRPKHWLVFTERNPPVFDFVFTLSDTASKEAFPDWPGKPASAHWRYPDPIKATGDEWQRKREFGRTLSALERQMRIFMQLPLARLDAIALQKHLDDMASEQPASDN